MGAGGESQATATSPTGEVQQSQKSVFIPGATSSEATAKAISGTDISPTAETTVVIETDNQNNDNNSSSNSTTILDDTGAEEETQATATSPTEEVQNSGESVFIPDTSSEENVVDISDTDILPTAETTVVIETDNQNNDNNSSSNSTAILDDTGAEEETQTTATSPTEEVQNSGESVFIPDDTFSEENVVDISGTDISPTAETTVVIEPDNQNNDNNSSSNSTAILDDIGAWEESQAIMILPTEEFQNSGESVFIPDTTSSEANVADISGTDILPTIETTAITEPDNQNNNNNSSSRLIQISPETHSFNRCSF
ncbi:MAG: hypothetical protein RSE13_04120 [Planktothrix sp. GU0601_MAG3]|nr:MAG: hypothetical protein RSE13_04120 [Planktothrix sp. GU0601_MAG3]